MSTITETKKEYYLSDANGHVIGLRSEVTPTGQTTQISWEYYAFGAEREARLTNLDSNPRFGPDEVSFYLNDHLGNTRVNYTPVATTIPPSDNEIFNDQFSQGQLLNWAGVNSTTVSVPSSSLVAQSPVGATQTVIHKAATFEASNTYTISVLAYFDNMTSIALECSGNTFTLIDNGLPNTFTFQGTDNSDGITITGLGAGTFSIKSINLTEHHPGGAVISYRINNAIDYFPYGKVLREYVGGEKERFLTTQHERDAETGLDYRGARYYDCDVARFLSLDPLARKYPSLSPFNYVGGMPIVAIDPDGKVIEFVGSKRDQRKLERSFNRIARKSETGKLLINDLRTSENVHTVARVFGDAGSDTHAKGDGTNGTNMNLNLEQKGEGGGAGWLNTAHELGHSWRIDQNKTKSFIEAMNTPDYSDFKPTSRLRYNEAMSKSKLHEEKEASHIENIIRTEAGEDKREVYSNIIQWIFNLSTKSVEINQIPITNVIKEGYDYNKSSQQKYHDLKSNN